MNTAHKLLCMAPSTPARLQVCPFEIPQPAGDEVLVKVEATSVNPIDVKRSAGYGRRLLALKGAARYPLTLGNDLAGIVLAAGPDATTWQPGDRVFGLVPTGPCGAHASHVRVRARHLRAAPAAHPASGLAALPYTFTTLYLALRSIGLLEAHARDKKVLIHGASGGLGQLAVQTLSLWGARVTAVCSTRHLQTCLDRGATTVIDRTQRALSTLPAAFDATLNFATWDDESALVTRLRPGALGHATTVHPLLSSMDTLGWLRGSWQVGRAWTGMRRLARQAGGAGTRYAWTVFRPDTAALDTLHHLLVSSSGLHLPIGLQVELDRAEHAFAHVAQQRAGRAILMPS